MLSHTLPWTLTLGALLKANQISSQRAVFQLRSGHSAQDGGAAQATPAESGGCKLPHLGQKKRPLPPTPRGSPTSPHWSLLRPSQEGPLEGAFCKRALDAVFTYTA